MLKNTFVHIPGISSNTEQQIWKNNIYNWDECLENVENLRLSNNKINLIKALITKSSEAYAKKDYNFFVDKLPGNQHWRAYPDLKKKCCFLDIETTGLDKHNDDVTIIGLYDGKKSTILVNGNNMDQFEKEMKKYDMIVTFNGKCFDVPFLKAKFPKVNFDKFHVDLRFAMREVGYSGGLKFIEKEVGIKRDDDLQEVDGWEAVRLWHKYKRGDNDALELLIKYNKADIENLKVLMEHTFEKLKEKNFHSVIS